MDTPVQVKLLLQLHKLENDGEGGDNTGAFEEVERNLDSSILKQYHRLKERKGTAVAILRDGVCSACNMIYPETHEILRYKNFIHKCEFCGRFLVVNGNAVKQSS